MARYSSRRGTNGSRPRPLTSVSYVPGRPATKFHDRPVYSNVISKERQAIPGRDLQVIPHIPMRQAQHRKGAWRRCLLVEIGGTVGESSRCVSRAIRQMGVRTRRARVLYIH